VQIGFRFLIPAEITGISSSVDENGILGRKTEEAAEKLHVCELDICAAYDCDCLSRAIDGGRGAVERIHVVDSGKIRRRHKMRACALSKVRRQLIHSALRMFGEIIQ